MPHPSVAPRTLMPLLPSPADLPRWASPGLTRFSIAPRCFVADSSGFPVVGPDASPGLRRSVPAGLRPSELAVPAGPRPSDLAGPGLAGLADLAGLRPSGPAGPAGPGLAVP